MVDRIPADAIGLALGAPRARGLGRRRRAVPCAALAGRGPHRRLSRRRCRRGRLVAGSALARSARRRPTSAAAWRSWCCRWCAARWHAGPGDPPLRRRRRRAGHAGRRAHARAGCAAGWRRRSTCCAPGACRSGSTSTSAAPAEQIVAQVRDAARRRAHRVRGVPRAATPRRASGRSTTGPRWCSSPASG